MEKVDISELLGSYAPLVQLMAGVYLLFYYSTMFKKKRPFDSMEKRMLKNFSEIIKSGNLYIEPNQIEKDRKLFLKLWREYKMSVEAVARIGCLYTITVLVYCGYEGVSGKIGLMALWIDSIICALYTVFVIFFIRKKELCKWWIWVGYMIIMIFIGFCCPPKNIDPSSFELFGIRCKYITHFVCLMSLFPALASIIQYIIDECHYAHINLCIVYSNRMSKKLSNLHMQIGAETEMQIFREKYGCVIGIDSWWEYENEEFSITIEDWERRVGEF